MKTFFLFFSFIIFCCCDVCSGQAKKYIYYFDENLNPVEQSVSLIRGEGYIENGSLKLDCFERETGKLLLTAHLTDTLLTALNGLFAKYYSNGKVEKQGLYLNGQENGSWLEWDSLGRKTDSVVYNKGKAVAKAKYWYHEKTGSISSFELVDSLQGSFESVGYDEKGVITSEVFFNGEKGILKNYENGQVKTDSLFTRERIEASFPGGEAGWRKYLQNNLNANIPVENNARAGMYKVIIRFVVKKDGSISDVKAETNYGFGMEKEVIRIIENGPKWIPTVQYGHKVNAYRRQPVTFVVAVQ